MTIRRKYTVERADPPGDENSNWRVLVWKSQVLDEKGTTEVVYCAEPWFWASPIQRKLLENEAAVKGFDEPWFNSYRTHPVRPPNKTQTWEILSPFRYREEAS